MVNGYFENIDRVILKFEEIIDCYYTRKNKYNETQGIITGNITFNDKSSLSFMEFIDLDLIWKIKYKYHYMNEDNKQVFRYDNAKHYPKMKTFPHHIHTGNTVLESTEPELFDVLIKVQDNLSGKETDYR